MQVSLDLRSLRTVLSALSALLLFASAVSAQVPLRDTTPEPSPKQQNLHGPVDVFAQLGTLLPTPSERRLASGAPGPRYWQQKVDYEIHVRIDEKERMLHGRERIVYHNRSPHRLSYLWLQLEPNRRQPHSDSNLTGTAPDLEKKLPIGSLRRILASRSFEGGVTLDHVRSGAGQELVHKVVRTMLRVDLPKPLAAGERFEFDIAWRYRINRKDEVSGRSMCEWFEKDENYIFELAQWFPRLCAYDDTEGWQNKQFLGRGEFALEFGDYVVHITVPADHVVASTGVLQNADQVLSEEQRKRYAEGLASDKPRFVVTPAEAKSNEKDKSQGQKTWTFAAKNVRDFAFATSRKFIWDVMGQDVGDRRVACMSFYPNEGEPLWSRYSTHAIAHTLEVYSRHTVPYPYPVAISVNGPVGGMEYPMITFNGPRPEEDGTYSKRTKYGLISVIIHEIGHNWFPMIINSDERQWTWMDEGMNTFVQFLAEREWEKRYPSRRGEARWITGYMASRIQVPIMTNSEQILQFGNNAYAKPATALNVLRETVLGRELFDDAFQEYARRWAFKRPTPADFFRTMEDASGIDLDWFWRGWFYTTKHVDISIERVREYRVSTMDPDVEMPLRKKERAKEEPLIGELRSKGLVRRIERFPELRDFYNRFDELDVTEQDREDYRRILKRLEPDERKLLETPLYFQVVDFENRGGLVSPLIVELQFEDGSKQLVRIPAEIWRRDTRRTSKLFVSDKPLASVRFDPYRETADIETFNDSYPRELKRSRFDIDKPRERKNDMQRSGLGEGPGNEKAEEEREAEAERRRQRGSGR
jgi:hypothetical protein